MEQQKVTQQIAELPAVNWSNERVLTTAQLAEFYEASTRQIQQNYNNNVDRFVEGKHFFRLEGDALRTFKHEVENFEVAAPQLNLLYLWTKRGAARHAKMLTTDKAWEVFEALEENYFDRRTVAPVNPTSELAAAISKLADVEREKLAHERDDFAKAQLLRELASASGDDYYLRGKLVRTATKIIMGENFFNDEQDSSDID